MSSCDLWGFVFCFSAKWPKCQDYLTAYGTFPSSIKVRSGTKDSQQPKRGSNPETIQKYHLAAKLPLKPILPRKAKNSRWAWKLQKRWTCQGGKCHFVPFDRPHFPNLGIKSVLRRVRNRHPFLFGGEGWRMKVEGFALMKRFFEYGLIDMNHSCIYYMSSLHLPIEKHSDRYIGWRWLESYVFQTSRITAMCPTTSVGWWQKIPINCCKNSAINTLHHSFAPATFALMFAGWDESDFGGKVTSAAWQDLRGISLIASEVTNANYYKAVEWMLHFEPLRVGLKRHIFATNQGASVPFDPAQITCPLDLRLTEIQVAKTGGGKGWSEIWNKRVLSRLPWNFWLYRGYLFKIHTLKSHDTTSCKICTTLTTCRPLLQVSCEQVPLSADLTVKLLILQSEMLSLYVWWRSIALFDLLLWHATLQSNNGSVLKPRSRVAWGNFGDTFSGQPGYIYT